MCKAFPPDFWSYPLGASRMATPGPTPAKAAAPLVWPLKITRDDRDGAAVFVVSGRLGTLSSGELVEALAKAVDAGDRRVVVDLAGVDYVSSAGLLALHALLGRFAVAGGELALCGLSVPVRTSFELSGLLSDFVEEPSRDLAIAHVTGRGTTA